MSLRPDHFATLVPCNKAAIMGFHRLCQAIRSDSSLYRPHREFMFIEPTTITLGEALAIVADPSSAEEGLSTDATDVDPEIDPLQGRVSVGGYLFSLDVAPQVHRLGWRAGYGRFSKDPAVGRVELVLGLSDDAKRSDVHGDHIRFNFLPDSAAFCVHANHPCRIDAEMLSGRQRAYVLNRPFHIVMIGELAYRYKHCISTGAEEVSFIERRDTYVTDTLGMEPPLSSASATPSVQDVQIGPWRLLKSVGKGTESVVGAAISQDGTLVPVKTLGRHKSTTEKEREIARYQRISNRTSGKSGHESLIAIRTSLIW